MSLPDHPFKSPRLCIDSSRDHLNEFWRLGKEYFDSNPYAEVEVTDSATGQRRTEVQITRELSDKSSRKAKDATTNLKDALDHALVASALAVGAPDVSYIQFPFGRSPSQVQKFLKGRRCQGVPDVIKTYVAGLQPTTGAMRCSGCLAGLPASNGIR
jgi:hypothetical protein